MKKIYLLSLLFLFIVGCSNKEEDTYSDNIVDIVSFQMDLEEHIEEVYGTQDTSVIMDKEGKLLISAHFNNQYSEEDLLEATLNALRYIRDRTDVSTIDINWFVGDPENYDYEMEIVLSGDEMRKIDYDSFEPKNLIKLSSHYSYN